MSKVYVITHGCYSSYHICAVTLEEDKAEMLAKHFSDGFDTAQIEEYDTDDASKFLKIKQLFMCYYWKDKNEITVAQTYYPPFAKADFTLHKTSKGAYVYVAADDKEMALEKASDLFAKFRSQEMGL